MGMKIFRNTTVVTAKAGKKFGIALSAASAAGYEWHIPDCPDWLQSEGEEFKLASRAIGAKTEQVFYFSAAAPGEAVLQFVCKREWETEPSETRRIELKVID